MPYMLIVPTVQLSDPVLQLVEMEAGNGLFHECARCMGCGDSSFFLGARVGRIVHLGQVLKI